MGFKFEKTSLEEVILIEPDIYKDERGILVELYKRSSFKEAGIKEDFVQFNVSISKKSVLRGLHYQINPAAQGKVVGVISGGIFDVAVDIRVGSPTYCRWFGVRLDAVKKNLLYIPPGFAHGFYSLHNATRVIYYCTAEYSREDSRGIIWNDKEIGIKWPISDSPILSKKDSKYPPLSQAENTFVYLES